MTDYSLLFGTKAATCGGSDARSRGGLFSRTLRQPLSILFCCGLLSLFAGAKLGTVVARCVGILPKVPVYEIASERLMVFTGIAEAIAIFCILYVFSTKLAARVITLIGLSFLLYRLSFNPTHCSCMGAAPTLIPWLKVNEQIVLVTVPCVLVLLGLWNWAHEATRR